LEGCGYIAQRNDDAKDGRWVVGGRRGVIYVKQTLVQGERLRAAKKRAEGDYYA
jgi:hypothetical protein